MTLYTEYVNVFLMYVCTVCSFSVQWVNLFAGVVFEILLLALMQLLIARKNQCSITKILGFNALISV